MAHRWPTQEVRFPNFSRGLSTGYSTITCERLHGVVTSALGAYALLGVTVGAVSEFEVALADGRTLKAPCIIDCRGPIQGAEIEVGYQKFVGHEIVTQAPHGVSAPVIMDASVEQYDGYRFVYLLPLAADQLLVEDTYYSDMPDLDETALDYRLNRYTADRGWQIRSILRRERGVLPIVLAGDIDAYWDNRKRDGMQALAGLRALLFHPVTGYSLPDAVGLADAIAECRVLETRPVAALVEARSRMLWRERSFLRALNRMLFRAAEPQRRWAVLARFYRLPEDLIGRFYAARLTPWDKARILAGKPPVPVLRAIRAFASGGGKRGLSAARSAVESQS